MRLDSSALQCVFYDRATQELTVVFNDHTCYRYSGVPDQDYDSLLEASSKGRVFNQEIRNRYPCRKLQLSEISLS